MKISRYDVQRSPLPPYDPEAPCRKCGSTDVGTHYQKPCSCEDRSFCEAEALIRHCRRCHFEWGEAVLEAAS